MRRHSAWVLTLALVLVTNLEPGSATFTACDEIKEETMEETPPFQVSSHFVEWKGAQVHYTVVGEGPLTMLCVHGWCCNQSFWRFQVPGLSGRIRLVMVDLPGHGKSAPPREPHSVNLYVDALHAALEDSGASRAVVAAHSNGVPMARHFYRRFPGKTQALILVDGTLRQLFKSPAMIDQVLAPFRGDGYQKSAEVLVDGMLPATMEESLRNSIREAMLATSQKVMIESFKSLSEPALWTEEKIEVPLLHLLARSPFWDEDYEAYVRSLAPQVHYQVLDGVSHFLMMDSPAEFDRRVLGFLTEEGLFDHSSSAPSKEK